MEKLTRIVIVGFPNVGKSTLFNRFLKRKRSLVHSIPGMTRDQIEMPCRLQEKKFILVDTGGFFDTQEEPISLKVKEKAWESAQESDIVLFVLDSKRELLPAEEELFVSLKKLGKTIFVVVNKIDSLSEESKLSDYYRLGEKRIFAVSAEHKRNLDYLEENILDILPAYETEEEEEKSLRIALVGRINVGKSSVVNRLCGEEKLIVSEIPGTTRDSTDTLIMRNKRAFSLVDTAGLRKLSRTKDKREKASIIKAKKDIKRADVICIIMDAQEFPTRQDTAVAHIALASGKPLLITLNKWDLIRNHISSPEAIKEKVYQKLDFVNYAPLLFISALTGKGVVKILDLAEEVYANGCKRIETSRLNKFLAWINDKYPPISRSKRRVKIKYMTQKRILPPTFILFTHSRVTLAPSYEKFFINFLRERFEFGGTPIRLIVKTS
ncbi:MAG: ribosome biogenesis GTPase Der [Candidatus Aminicenantaceae bacterium]